MGDLFLILLVMLLFIVAIDGGPAADLEPWDEEDDL